MGKPTIHIVSDERTFLRLDMLADPVGEAAYPTTTPIPAVITRDSGSAWWKDLEQDLRTADGGVIIDSRDSLFVGRALMLALDAGHNRILAVDLTEGQRQETIKLLGENTVRFVTLEGNGVDPRVAAKQICSFAMGDRQ